MVSVIIATFNAERTLERCLTSLRSQSARGWELIVADGGSDDATLAILDRHADVIAARRSARDRGIYDAWNWALTQATGDYVCFLGADDAWAHADAIAHLVDLARNTDADIVSGRGRMHDASGRTMSIIGRRFDPATAPRRIGICHPGTLHRRALFEQYGPFDATLRIVGDLDFLMRLPVTTITAHTDEVVVDVEDGGISRSQFRRRIAERRRVHARSPRVGPARAWLYWADKMWRMPIARLLRLNH